MNYDFSSRPERLWQKECAPPLRRDRLLHRAKRASKRRHRKRNRQGSILSAGTFSFVLPVLVPCLFDRTDEQECRLGKVIALAVDDLAEPMDRVVERYVCTLDARELLGYEERLRQESLDLTGTLDEDLILVRQLVHAHDGDDIHEFLISLEDSLDLFRDEIVFFAEDVR